MSARPIPSTRRARSIGATLAVIALLSSMFALLLPASASAATTSTPRAASRPAMVRVAAPDATRVASVLRVAASLAGAPYRAGGTSPAGFDCSGFTRYVFATVGVSLVHSSATQYAQSVRIDPSEVQPGDLIFFHTSSGHVYHVAIYAGGGRIWHAQHTGTLSGLTPLWGNDWYAGRVL